MECFRYGNYRLLDFDIGANIIFARDEKVLFSATAFDRVGMKVFKTVSERKSIVLFVSEVRRACRRPIMYVRNFIAHEDGAMIGFSLLVFLAMLIFSGLAIDLMRHELFRTRMQSTLDRALLAAAHPDQETNRKDVVLDYFKRAGLDGIVKRNDIKVKVALDGTSVTAIARSDLHTPFLNYVGVSSLPVPVGGGAAKANVLTEISLVVDVSGSMADPSSNGVSKISELRTAATEFSNLLLCDPKSPATPASWDDCAIKSTKTSLSLVPYSTQVNVGADILGKFDRQDAQTDAYCVTFADSDFTKTAVDPKVDMDVEPEKAVRQAAKFFRYNQASWRSGGNFQIPAAEHRNWDAYWSCHTDSWREVVALEDNPAHMKTRIDALQASGDTAIDIGMKWGVALLDNAMEPVVSDLVSDGLVHGEFANRPLDPTVTASSKFVVLMTDGQNTNHHHLVDGYRTGPSLFWRNAETGMISVLDKGLHLDSDHDDMYLWFDPNESERTTGQRNGMPNYQRKKRPFGMDGARDCHNNRHGTRRCSTRNHNTTERMTWEEFWAAGYTWRMFELAEHTRFNQRNDTTNLVPGRLISNSNFSGSTDANGNPIREIDKRLLDQCDAAKRAGITIYTIEMETPNTATDAMQSCASTKEGNRLHYKVDANLDLSTVFGRIAEDINRLRLTH